MSSGAESAADICGDERFFESSGPHSLADVALVAGSAAPGQHLLLRGVAPLQRAAPDQVSFLDNRRYVRLLAETRAGAVILHPDLAAQVPPGSCALATAEPGLGWSRVAAMFHPERPANPGIHPSAVVAPDAAIDPSAEIGPLVVIGSGVVIGPGCRIGAGTTIDRGVVLGADCRIGAQVSLSHAIIGDRVQLYPGVRVGQDGFGFIPGADGFISMPQLGRVQIGDDVQVGANTTIDRGAASDTVIGAGSRLDNLVQIGHNVRLGRCCIVVAQVGISGSTVVDDFVSIGGQAGLAGHLHIGRGVRIGAQAGVITNLAPQAEVLGSPAQPVREFFRHVAMLRRLGRREDVTHDETKQKKGVV